MAKKAVAGFRDRKKEGESVRVKCIKMGRSAKTGAYTFQEQMVVSSEIQNFFNDKN